MLSLLLLPVFYASTALTSPLQTRDYSCRQTSISYDGFMYFAPSWPTCANDAHLTDALGSPASVTVQPDCDNAISAACSAVDLMFNISRNLYPIKSVSASCEVDILWSQQHVSQIADYDLSSCVTSLQSITETCMLIGTGKYAKEGAQAGVVNLLYDTMALDKDGGQRFAADTQCNDQPAYLAGSPGYFKDPNPYSDRFNGVGADIGGVAAGAITTECLLSDSCS